MTTPVQLPPVIRGQQYNTTAMADFIPYHLLDTRMREHWKVTGQGEGITVAVLDTGIQVDHPEFQDLDIKGECFLRRCRHGIEDRNYHGTHCAGLVAGKTVGVAPKLKRLLVGKVLGDNGSGDNKGVTEGIYWAVQEGANIISMSLGSPWNDLEMQRAIEYGKEQGVIFIIAVGNESNSRVSYPAVHGLGITAVDQMMKLAWFANRGRNVDLAGYGVDVYSAVPDGYQKMSGTSMATPFIAGIGALLQGQELKQTGEIRTKTDEDLRSIETLVTDLGPEGFDTGTGRGFPDLDRLFYRHLPEPVKPQKLFVQVTNEDGFEYQPSTIEP